MYHIKLFSTAAGVTGVQLFSAELVPVADEYIQNQFNGENQLVLHCAGLPGDGDIFWASEGPQGTELSNNLNMFARMEGEHTFSIQQVCPSI